MQGGPNVAELRAARDEIADLIRSKECNPILIRLGWHDAGTYDKVCAVVCWWMCMEGGWVTWGGGRGVQRVT